MREEEVLRRWQVRTHRAARVPFAGESKRRFKLVYGRTEELFCQRRVCLEAGLGMEIEHRLEMTSRTGSAS